MKMPALAVVGADHQIIRSTETFRHKCENPAALCESSPELDLVLRGQSDAAVIDLGDFSLAVEAVTDAAGKRSAMLSLTAEDLEADPEAPLAALREAADGSPAIVWVKDLEGRYLYANARYAEDLDTSEDRLVGKTDAELPPVETVDGPRLRYVDDGLKEPLQLEYNVPAFESRPPMVAFRFPLRNGRGQPIATCGVAASSISANVARDEAVRLMQLERWNRLDPHDVRAELLEQWHVQVTPGPVEDVKTDPPVQRRNGHGKLSLRRRSADVAAPAEPAPVTAPDPVEEPVASVEVVIEAEPVVEEVETAPPNPVEPAASAAAEQPVAESAVAEGENQVSHHREEEWVRQLRQSAQMAPLASAADTADALQSDLQLARKWAERADQLQGELHDAHARIREVEGEAQQSLAAAQQAAAAAQQALTELEAARSEVGTARAAAEAARAETETARAEAEAARAEADAARAETEAARAEADAVRAQAESMRGPADAAMKLSEELGRALAAEQERGDELTQTLTRIRARLGDLEGAVDRNGSSSGKDAIPADRL